MPVTKKPKAVKPTPVSPPKLPLAKSTPDLESLIFDITEFRKVFNKRLLSFINTTNGENIASMVEAIEMVKDELHVLETTVDNVSNELEDIKDRFENLESDLTKG